MLRRSLGPFCQMCEASCEGNAFYGLQYGVEVRDQWVVFSVDTKKLGVRRQDIKLFGVVERVLWCAMPKRIRRTRSKVGRASAFL